MKRILPVLLLGLLACGLSSVVVAADNPQHERMAKCNKEAADKKGDERKQFMSECLKKDRMSQQDKMKACNQQAGDKKGDERKQFMSECLKK